MTVIVAILILYLVVHSSLWEMRECAVEGEKERRWQDMMLLGRKAC